jgi:hypothetical protein
MMLAGAVLLAATAGAQSYPPPYPRKNATKVLETKQFIVWNMVWPKGEPTPMHRHVHDQMGTYYASGGRRITALNSEIREATTPVGNLSNTKKGTTHIEEGTTDPPLRAVFLELLHDGPSGPPVTTSTTPALFPRDGAKQTFDDERITVWDYTWQPGTSTGTIRHPRNAMMIWLGTGSLKVTSSAGAVSTLAVEPGTTRYLEAGTTERLDAVTGSPRVMVFEFK